MGKHLERASHTEVGVLILDHFVERNIGLIGGQFSRAASGCEHLLDDRVALFVGAVHQALLDQVGRELVHRQLNHAPGHALYHRGPAVGVV